MKDLRSTVIRSTIIVDNNGNIKQVIGTRESKPSQSSFKKFCKASANFFKEPGSEPKRSIPLHWREVDAIKSQVEKKAELVSKKISKKIKLENDAKIYAKRAARWKRAALIHALFMGISGFIVGAILMAKCILEDHGPTVTIHGTITASLLYIGFGLLLGSVLAGVSIADAKNHCIMNKRKERKKTVEAAQTEAEIKDLMKDVEKLNETYIEGLKGSSLKPHSGVAV